MEQLRLDLGRGREPEAAIPLTPRLQEELVSWMAAALAAVWQAAGGESDDAEASNQPQDHVGAS